MTTFGKDATTLDQQIEILLSRGLIMDEPERAKGYLKNISYFRLSAYTKSFYTPGSSAEDHKFLPETTFEKILKLYIFDRELRLLLLDAIERLEVSLRAQLTQALATEYGPFGYLKPDIFITEYRPGKRSKRKLRTGKLRHFCKTIKTNTLPPLIYLYGWLWSF